MIKVQRRINSVHTQEQKKEVFKKCQKEMLFIREMLDNKSISENSMSILGNKVFNMHQMLLAMYVEDLEEMINPLPHFAIPSIFATLKIFSETLEKQLDTIDKIVAKELIEQGVAKIEVKN